MGQHASQLHTSEANSWYENQVERVCTTCVCQKWVSDYPLQVAFSFQKITSRSVKGNPNLET